MLLDANVIDRQRIVRRRSFDPRAIAYRVTNSSKQSTSPLSSCVVLGIMESISTAN